MLFGQNLQDTGRHTVCGIGLIVIHFHSNTLVNLDLMILMMFNGVIGVNGMCHISGELETLGDTSVKLIGFFRNAIIHGMEDSLKCRGK